MLVKKAPEIISAACSCRIPLGKGMYATVDYEDYMRLGHFYWQAKKSKACWYAVRKVRRNGKTIYIKMHREIMNAPPGTDVHHRNHISLDNRKCNLLVCSPAGHKYFHK